jgi:Xaa-Pro aminopeptidase
MEEKVMAISESAIRKPLPFDAGKLDKLMDEAGMDVLIATSKHNVQYLMGDCYRFFFFETMDAIGTSRYLPALVYRKGKPQDAAYVGCAMETYEEELGRFWTPTLDLKDTGSEAAIRNAAAHIKKLGGVRRVGVEKGFLPADAEAVLRRDLSNVDIVDATVPLERMRLRKTPEEIELLRKASEGVVASMMATFKACKPGMTKHEMFETLRREEVNRGMVFDYCLSTAGTSLNRAPSEQRLQVGDIISLDSGGNYRGYIGDLCRMGILGAKPDSELEDLLGWVEEVQQATRKPIKPGARGGDIIDIGERMVRESPHAKYSHYMAHGMGLVSHEGPRLMNLPRLSYGAADADKPLESGMVISIETTMGHPKRGFVKLEDTVLVTDGGHEGMGDGARGWNSAG